MLATTGALVPQRSAFRPLLSHKAASERSEGSRLVGAGGDRSHVARTKFVPGGSPNRRRHKERRALTLIYKKNEP